MDMPAAAPSTKEKRRLENDHKQRCDYVEQQNKRIDQERYQNEKEESELKESVYENTVRYLDERVPTIHRNSVSFRGITLYKKRNSSSE